MCIRGAITLERKQLVAVGGKDKGGGGIGHRLIGGLGDGLIGGLGGWLSAGLSSRLGDRLGAGFNSRLGGQPVVWLCRPGGWLGGGFKISLNEWSGFLRDPVILFS
ncbi:hypothetical protein Tco_0575923 [Tanacetum coccineum]